MVVYSAWLWETSSTRMMTLPVNAASAGLSESSAAQWKAPGLSRSAEVKVTNGRGFVDQQLAEREDDEFGRIVPDVDNQPLRAGRLVDVGGRICGLDRRQLQVGDLGRDAGGRWRRGGRGCASPAVVACTRCGGLRASSSLPRRTFRVIGPQAPCVMDRAMSRRRSAVRGRVVGRQLSSSLVEGVPSISVMTSPAFSGSSGGRRPRQRLRQSGPHRQLAPPAGGRAASEPHKLACVSSSRAISAINSR